MEKAIVLVSGGINSAVAAWLTKEQASPALMHVAWGHRAGEREKECFEHLGALLEVEKSTIVEVPALAGFGHNSRSSRRVSMEDATHLTSDTPSTFVLGLVPTLLSLAATWAGTIGARRIIIGLNEDYDLPGPRIGDLYPDYRQEFVQTFNLMLQYAKPHRRELMVEAPLIDLTRHEILMMAQRMQIPFDKTWSCYRQSDQPCGRCWGCSNRSSGFMAINAPDPLATEALHAAHGR
jgi:7-cyano-7-deazaguanine synthase